VPFWTKFSDKPKNQGEDSSEYVNANNLQQVSYLPHYESVSKEQTQMLNKHKCWTSYASNIWWLECVCTCI